MAEGTRPVPKWAVETTHLGSKAVSDTSNLLDALFAEALDGGFNDGVDVVGLVLLDPAGKVDLSTLHSSNVDGIAGEEVRNNGEVAILGKLVSDELAVGVDTEDVGQDEDGLVGLLLGLGEVGLHCETDSKVSNRSR